MGKVKACRVFRGKDVQIEMRNSACQTSGQSGDGGSRNRLGEVTGVNGDWSRSWESKVERGRVAGLTAVLGCGAVVGSKATAFMTNLLQVVCDHWVSLYVPVRFVFGCYLDRKNDNNCLL